MSHRHDREYKERAHVFPSSAEAIERDIRARELQTINELRAQPWLAGRGLASTVAECRRRHTASIARSNADRRSTGHD